MTAVDGVARLGTELSRRTVDDVLDDLGQHGIDVGRRWVDGSWTLEPIARTDAAKITPAVRQLVRAHAAELHRYLEGALEQWQRELAAGTRKVTTLDRLHRAACRCAADREWEAVARSAEHEAVELRERAGDVPLPSLAAQRVGEIAIELRTVVAMLDDYRARGEEGATLLRVFTRRRIALLAELKNLAEGGREVPSPPATVANGRRQPGAHRRPASDTVVRTLKRISAL